MYGVILTNAFKKDLKLVLKRGCKYEDLQTVVSLLQEGERLPEKYKDHQLTGKLSRLRELHIYPDWLLIYLRDKDKLILTLTRTGSHSDLFKK